MKNLILFISLCAFLNTQSSVAQSTDEEIYQRYALAKLSKKRNTGIALTSVGSTFLVGGVIMAATAEWNTTRTGNSVNVTSKQPQAVIGVLAAIAGIPMLIVGIVKTIKGKNLIRDHQLKSQYSLIMDHTPQGTTIGLAYRF